MIFARDGKQYNNEQEIINGGLGVIYDYCLRVNGRWRDIEHLIIEDAEYGYSYARFVIRGRYEPELETLYLMRHSGYRVKWYIEDLVRV